MTTYWEWHRTLFEPSRSSTLIRCLPECHFRRGLSRHGDRSWITLTTLCETPAEMMTTVRCLMLGTSFFVLLRLDGPQFRATRACWTRCSTARNRWRGGT